MAQVLKISTNHLKQTTPKKTLRYTDWGIEAAQKNLTLQVQECYTKANSF
jgi:hypothetical protein